MNGYDDLIRAGYKPEQIITCAPCKCKDALEEGRPLPFDCVFPSNGMSVEEFRQAMLERSA